MWPFVLVVQLLVVDLPRPLDLGQDAAEIILIEPGDSRTLRKVAAIVADPTENLVLRLRDVEADGDPGVSWEVCVASSDPRDRDSGPVLVGILSLYGAPPRASFSLPLDAAIAAGRPVGLKLIFTPISGLDSDGEAVPPTVRHPARIGGISLETERSAGGSERRGGSHTESRTPGSASTLRASSSTSPRCRPTRSHPRTAR